MLALTPAILAERSSNPKKCPAGPGAHIGMTAGSGAQKLTWPHIDRWLAARSR